MACVTSRNMRRNMDVTLVPAKGGKRNVWGNTKPPKGFCYPMLRPSPARRVK